MAGYWHVVIPEAGTNLVANPSLETDTTGWTSGATSIARSANYARFGAYSLQVVTSTDYQFAYYSVTLANSTAYTVSAWVYSPTEFTALLRVNDTTDTPITSELVVVPANTWVQLTASGSTDTHGGNYIAVYAASAATFYIDGVQLEQTSVATTYIDGDQPGCQWTGAKHASTSTRSALTRAGGRVVDLEDYGAYTVKMGGFGMPPLAWNAQERALISGATVQSVKAKPRAMVITFDVEGTSLANYHSIRDDLVDAFKPDRVPYVNNKPQPVLLQYTGAGPTVEIEAYYAAGLDGELDKGFGEEIAVLFMCYDPYFYSLGNGSAGLTYTQTSTNANYIMEKIAGAWDNMAGGLTGNVAFDLAIGADGSVYVAGGFDAAGGVAGTLGIAKWVPSSTAWAALSTGANGIVWALTPDPAGNVYAGGEFTRIGASTSVYIGKWNGSTWAALSTGLPGNCYALAMGQASTLFAGGNSYLKQWLGSSFGEPTTSTIGGYIFALDVTPNGDLYIGGNFTIVNGSTTAAYICRLVKGATSLTALTTTPINNEVRSIVHAPDGTVYLAGSFTTAGGVTNADYVMAYNGSRYLPLASGLDGPCYSLHAANDGTVYAVGNFTVTGMDNNGQLMAWNGYSWTHVDFYPNITSTVGYSKVATNEQGDLFVAYGSTNSTAVHSALNTITNNGSAEARPVFAFTCNTTGTQLPVVEWVKNEDTNKTLYCNYALQKGETLEIDTEQHTIQSDYFGNVPRAVLPNSDMGSFSLLPGSNNLSVFVTGSSTQCNVNATWQERYWSVDGVSTST